MSDCIHTLDARENVLLAVIRGYLDLTPQQMFAVIQGMATELREILKVKGIRYPDLRSALVPPRENRDVALVFDKLRISESWYGYVIQGRILRLLAAGGNHSVLQGTYLKRNLSEDAARANLESQLTAARELSYESAAQYFIVYISNCSDDLVRTIHSNLTSYDPYAGLLDLTFASRIKTQLSSMLGPAYIAHGKTIIGFHADDTDDRDDTNMLGYPFEQCGFSYRSVGATLGSLFLTYKIRRRVLRGFADDQVFSTNALSGQPTTLAGYQVRLDASKLDYLRESKTGSLKRLGLIGASAEELAALIREQLEEGYLYSLCRDDQYGTLKFNVMLEPAAADTGLVRRLVVALEYLPGEGCLRVITLF